VRQQFGLIPVRPTQLIEPFAGGGMVSLTSAAEDIVDHVTMVEIDEDVAAVWQTILDGEHWVWLNHEIETFDSELVRVFLLRTWQPAAAKSAAKRREPPQAVRRGVT